MSADRRPELPQGYTWRECPIIEANVAVPNGWYFLEQVPQFNVVAYYISKESLLDGNPDLDQPSFTLMAFPYAQYFSRVGSAVDYARMMATSLSTAEPLTDVEIETKPPFVTFIRQFMSESRDRAGLTRRLHVFLNSVGNQDTNAAYIMTFTTPHEETDQYSAMADILMRSTLLSKFL